MRVCTFLSVYGVEGYAPRFPPSERTRPGSVRDRKARWVFPGYLFFRVPEGFAQWDNIRWAPGVRRVLEQDDGPAGVGDGVIERIRERLSERSLSQPRARFTPRQRVVILRGPLRMVDAIFDTELDASGRVRVLVQLLGRQLSVDVSPAILEATG